MQWTRTVLFLALALSGQTGAQAFEPPSQPALWALSASVQALTRRVHPCVVKIVAMGFSGDGDSGGNAGVVARGLSTGSGVVIDQDGLIVTNAHVLAGADRVQVTFPSDATQAARALPGASVAATVGARVLGVDAEADVALIKVPLTGLPHLALEASAAVQQGQVVLAFGSPMGLDDSVTLGVISSPARQLDPEDPVAYVQTDAPINPGSSGGPLVDAEGRLVGINTLILSKSGGSEGLGFAVPVDLVAAVVDQLRRTGRVTPGDIGLGGRTNGQVIAQALRLRSETGVVVQDVEPDGPAHRSGLRPGDLIERIDAIPLAGLPQLHVALYRASIGSGLHLGVLRDGERRDFEVKVRRRSPVARRLAGAVAAQNLVPDLGVFVLDLDEELAGEIGQARGTGGVLVVAELDQVPVLGESLQVDDIIYRMNQQSVTDAARLRELINGTRPGEPVAFQVERSGQLHFVVMELAKL
jgi:serine protease Do